MNNTPVQVFAKVYGIFIREMPDEDVRLLVYAAPDGAFRFPGGTVEAGEGLITGLKRELREEVGLDDFEILRTLGTHCYYKPDVQKHVERHDYLLRSGLPLPESFSITVQSVDKDTDLIFTYRWIGAEEIPQLDWEFSNQITPEYIPEFFKPGNN